MKSDYTYDGNGNPTLASYSSWDENSSQWTNSSKSDYNYDLSYNISDLILPDTWTFMQNYPGNITNMLEDINSFSFIDNAWISTQEVTYYYSEVNVGINETFNIETVVYPNPSSDYMLFKTDDTNKLLSIELFDIHGNMVLSITDYAGEEISVMHINKGLYFYKLSNSKNVTKGKVIIH